MRKLRIDLRPHTGTP